MQEGGTECSAGPESGGDVSVGLESIVAPVSRAGPVSVLRVSAPESRGAPVSDLPPVSPRPEPLMAPVSSEQDVASRRVTRAAVDAEDNS